ncbi:MAG: MBL fold metallo-hydrolase [candidate division KSB1 bacterium]|nr:MBL fold metallo-hydrolase [candidate division KSB1 bacterium]
MMMILLAALALGELPCDVVPSTSGDLQITFIGHGTLYFTWQNKVVHVDPWSRLADYTALPKADVVLITHHHRDHLDPAAVAQIRKPETTVILTEKCAAEVQGKVMKNSDSLTVAGLNVRAVPAYNLVHKRDSGEPFHVKGEGNGYLITFGKLTVYIAGDTENIPEMAALHGRVDIAFLPVNLPYTMDAEMAAAAARAIRPKILYPYHYNPEQVAKLQQLLAGEPIEVRVRAME